MMMVQSKPVTSLEMILWSVWSPFMEHWSTFIVHVTYQRLVTSSLTPQYFISTCCTVSTFRVSVPSPSCRENKGPNKINCISKPLAESLLMSWMKASERTKINLFQKVLFEWRNSTVSYACAKAFPSLQVCHKNRAQCLSGSLITDSCKD